jgi:hypothetical protein
MTHGNSIMVTGTVMDVSPGTEDEAVKLRFPNGVAAVSDADMTDWMLYVYNQFERPADVTGVQVTIEVIDGNNNYQNIGTTTTDANGNYGLMFTPEVPGQYMIIATFGGTNSYYGSFATGYFGVDTAPTPASPIEPEEPEMPDEPVEPTQPVETPFITTEIAIIVAVAAVAAIGVVAFWMLKRK